MNYGCLHALHYNGVATDPADLALVELPFAGKLNFPSCIITREPNFQMSPLAIHTHVFFLLKMYVWEEGYAQIFSSKLIQFLVIAALQ